MRLLTASCMPFLLAACGAIPPQPGPPPDPFVEVGKVAIEVTGQTDRVFRVPFTVDTPADRHAGGRAVVRFIEREQKDLPWWGGGLFGQPAPTTDVVSTASVTLAKGTAGTRRSYTARGVNHAAPRNFGEGLFKTWTYRAEIDVIWN